MESYFEIAKKELYKKAEEFINVSYMFKALICLSLLYLLV